MTSPTIKCYRTPYAIEAGIELPRRATEWAAGFDLSIARFVHADLRTPLMDEKWQQRGSASLLEGGRMYIDTGVKFLIPEGYFGKLYLRSSIGRMGIVMLGEGVIDRDYTGTPKIIIKNVGEAGFTFSVGDRIAQIVFHRIGDGDLEEVDEGGIPLTQRGDGGFGSTNEG